jgi:hypothetical protein
MFWSKGLKERKNGKRGRERESVKDCTQHTGNTYIGWKILETGLLITLSPTSFGTLTLSSPTIFREVGHCIVGKERPWGLLSPNYPEALSVGSHVTFREHKSR